MNTRREDSSMIAWCLHDLIVFNSYHINITVCSSKRGRDETVVLA